MRPNQQNRRMRGRGNRKGPNPLTRSYESNGPDVKIRGSAQQIADKYSSLARDAHSSGDRVMAENYLQHAEHYNRLIAAALAQSGQAPQRDLRDDDEDGDDDYDGRDDQAGPWSEPQADVGSGPQPVIDGLPAEVAMAEEGFAGDGNRGDGNRPRDNQGDDGFRRNRRNRRNRHGGQADGERRDIQRGDQAAAADGAGDAEPGKAESGGDAGAPAYEPA